MDIKFLAMIICLEFSFILKFSPFLTTISKSKKIKEGKDLTQQILII